MNENLLKAAEFAGFILTDDKTGIDWSSNYDDQLVAFAIYAKQLDSDFAFVCLNCGDKLKIFDGDSNED